MKHTYAGLKDGRQGFSLVELIVVVAIMAALVAGIAPQYLKYVEKSRIAADEATIREFCRSLHVGGVDTDYTHIFGAGTILLSRHDPPQFDPEDVTTTDYPRILYEHFGEEYLRIRLQSDKYGEYGVTVRVAPVSTGGYTVTWERNESD